MNTSLSLQVSNLTVIYIFGKGIVLLSEALFSVDDHCFFKTRVEILLIVEDFKFLQFLLLQPNWTSDFIHPVLPLVSVSNAIKRPGNNLNAWNAYLLCVTVEILILYNRKQRVNLATYLKVYLQVLVLLLM